MVKAHKQLQINLINWKYQPDLQITHKDKILTSQKTNIEKKVK
jgi:hypothetical protein